MTAVTTAIQLESTLLQNLLVAVVAVVMMVIGVVIVVGTADGACRALGDAARDIGRRGHDGRRTLTPALATS